MYKLPLGCNVIYLLEGEGGADVLEVCHAVDREGSILRDEAQRNKQKSTRRCRAVTVAISQSWSLVILVVAAIL